MVASKVQKRLKRWGSEIEEPQVTFTLIDHVIQEIPSLVKSVRQSDGGGGAEHSRGADQRGVILEKHRRETEVRWMVVGGHVYGGLG